MDNRDEAAARAREGSAAEAERREAAAARRGAAAERREAAAVRREAAAVRREAAAEVPDPPWWASEKRKSARSALSRDRIVEAALWVLDRDGLDGLSMRRVADELGTSAASLYWHVANKDQLLNVLIDRVIGEVALPEPDPERWEEQLRAFARDGRAAFRRYGDLARATLGRIPIGPNLLRTIDWLLELLEGAGIPPRPAAWFGDIFSLYIAAHAFEESQTEDASADEAAAAMAAYLRSVPPEAFPFVMAAAGEIMAGVADERFEYGLDLLIAGLRAHSHQPDPTG